MTADRPSFGLAVQANTSLDRKDQGSALTSAQTRQVLNATVGYLREIRQLDSVSNMGRATPVVRRCIYEGLVSTPGRRWAVIQPGDDLGAAYRVGKRVRDGLLERIKEEIDPLASGNFAKNALALPTTLVQATSSELKNRAFEASFTNCKAALAEGDRRKPLMASLIQLAVDGAAEVIPGAQQVPLTEDQKLLLARKFVFIFIARGSTFPIIGAEDFVANREAYFRNLAAGRDKLATLLASGGEEGIALATQFVNDLTQQIAGPIRTLPKIEPELPGGETRTLALIGSLYKHLNEYFGIENPFLRLPFPAKEPGVKGSVWRAGQTVTVQAGPSLCEVPRPEILMQAAITAKATGNLQAGAEFDRAAEAVRNFIAEMSTSRHPELIAAAEKEYGAFEREEREFVRNGINGNYSELGYFTPEELQRQIDLQLTTMEDERQFMASISKAAEAVRQHALLLLEKYIDGRHAEEEDEDSLVRLDLNAAELAEKCQHLVSRVSRRVLLLESFHSDIGAREGFTTMLRGNFSQAIETSHFDILQAQTSHWRNALVGEQHFLEGANALTTWKELVGFEEARLRALLYEQAYILVRESREHSNSHPLVQSRVAREIVEGPDGWLSGKVATTVKERRQSVEDWKSQVERGKIPNIKTVPTRLLVNFVSDSREKRLKAATRAWTPSRRLYPLFVTDDFKAGARKGKLKGLFGVQHGPTRIILNALAKTLPHEEQAAPEPLEAVAHTTRSSYWSSGRIEQHTQRCVQWLGSNGYTLSEAVFSFVLPNDATERSLGTYTAISQIHAVEEEMGRWFASQEQKLAQKLQGPHARILKASPDELYRRIGVRLRAVESHLYVLRRDWEKTVESRTIQLERMGVLQVVSSVPTEKESAATKPPDRRGKGKSLRTLRKMASD